MKLSRNWFVVLPGKIHPEMMQKGAECPSELMGEAQAAGVLALPKSKADKSAPETK